MNFSNLSPADRMKASGLIGLIVVSLFVFVHTMLGAVGKKPPSQAAVQQAVGNTVGLPGAPASGDAAAAAAGQQPAGSDPFPTKRVAMKPGELRTKLNMDIPDPFVPIATKPSSAPPPAPAPRREPGIDVTPSHEALPPLRPQRGFDFGPAPLQAAPAGIVAPVKPQPPIHVVGLVDGEPGIATLTVGGKTVMARPGDALADGYRLADIDSEGVAIAQHGRVVRVRVGDGLNEVAPAKP